MLASFVLPTTMFDELPPSKNTPPKRDVKQHVLKTKPFLNFLSQLGGIPPSAYEHTDGSYDVTSKEENTF